MFTSWIGLFISMGVLLVVSRKSLPLAFALSAITLGAFTLPPVGIWRGVWSTVADPSVLLLAVAMGIIPMIGGIMEVSGQMDRLVNNLRIGKKAFLALSPALFGTLPMPGGALLSSPMVERAGEGIEGRDKAALNVWFRHALLIIYPLNSALIVSAKIAGLEVHRAILYLLPSFVVVVIIGWVFFLRDVEGEILYRGTISARDLLLPLSIILLAPLLSFLLPQLFAFGLPEWTTLIAVSCSLGLALFLGDLSWEDVKKINERMVPWNFSLIIVGMFLFLNIFKASGVSELLAASASSILLLCIISFLLGVITGRVQLPTSVVIPTYLSMTGGNPMPPTIFTLVFFSAFLGYLISPVHPCVSVSTEYFGVRIGDYLKAAALPTLVAFIPTLALALLV
ncbi:MAG: DUF401 family protein [Chloroflexota bacterium]|nr:DUF401 family protein [Chloroflexota bacterium]